MPTTNKASFRTSLSDLSILIDKLDKSNLSTSVVCIAASMRTDGSTNDNSGTASKWPWYMRERAATAAATICGSSWYCFIAAETYRLLPWRVPILASVLRHQRTTLWSFSLRTMPLMVFSNEFFPSAFSLSPWRYRRVSSCKATFRLLASPFSISNLRKAVWPEEIIATKLCQPLRWLPK